MVARTTQIWATVQMAGYIKSRGSGERGMFRLIEISTLFSSFQSGPRDDGMVLPVFKYGLLPSQTLCQDTGWFPRRADTQC